MTDCTHPIRTNGVCDLCGVKPEPQAIDWDAFSESARQKLAAKDRFIEMGAEARRAKQEKNWGSGSLVDGTVIPQLHPKDPDRWVTNEKQMRRVYDKNGLCMDTGEVKDKKKFEGRQTQMRAKNRRKGWQSGHSAYTKTRTRTE